MERNFKMTNEDQLNLTPEEQQLLEKAVADSLAAPIPEEAVKKKPHFFQTVGFKKYRQKLTSDASKDPDRDPKLDTEGKEIPHGNGGIVYVKTK